MAPANCRFNQMKRNLRRQCGSSVGIAEALGWYSPQTCTRRASRRARRTEITAKTSCSWSRSSGQGWYIDCVSVSADRRRAREYARHNLVRMMLSREGRGPLGGTDLMSGASSVPIKRCALFCCTAMVARPRATGSHAHTCPWGIQLGHSTRMPGSDHVPPGGAGRVRRHP